MAVIGYKVGFTIEFDADALGAQTPYIFIYQLLNRLAYEHNITSITVGNKTQAITNKIQLKCLPLGCDNPLN